MKKKAETQSKVVRIKENDLVTLIEGIVNDTVAKKKSQWISENKKVNTVKMTGKSLEDTINKIVEQRLSKK